MDPTNHAAATAFEAGRRAHPTVSLSPEDFRRAWTDRAAREGGPPDAGTAEDFFLASACSLGVEGAWAALERTYSSRLRGLLRRRGVPEGEAEEILADLPGDLCAPPPGGGAATRIGTYSGGGSLLAWLRVYVLRRWADRARRHDPRPLPAPATTGGACAPSFLQDASPTPLRTILHGEALRRFGEVLAEAWTDLTPREALAVLLRYRDGLPQHRIAALLGVGEPRVSQLLQAATTKLHEAVRRRLRETPLPGDDALWTLLVDAVVIHLARFPGASDSPIGGRHGK